MQLTVLVLAVSLASVAFGLPAARPALVANDESAPALDARIVSLISKISQDRVLANVRYLSGEDPASPITTRQSQSESGLVAAEWILGQLSSYGWSGKLYFYTNPTGYNPNVIAEIRGTDLADELVIMGAHYDDRQRNSSSRVDRAPGANDDGSGSSMLLEVARVLGEASRKKEFASLFRRTIQVNFYSGEEQGLYGSRAYAKDLKSKNVTVAGMIQSDMVGYHNPATNIGASLVNRFTDPTYTAFAKSIATQYVPNFNLTSDPACCSDHQSFFENSYPSIGLVEQGGAGGLTGYTVDPQYHQPGDFADREGYSAEQIAQVGKIVLAVAASTAEFA